MIINQAAPYYKYFVEGKKFTCDIKLATVLDCSY